MRRDCDSACSRARQDGAVQEAMETTTIQLDKWESRTLTFLIADSIGPLWRSECQRKRSPFCDHYARSQPIWKAGAVRQPFLNAARLIRTYPEQSLRPFGDRNGKANHRVVVPLWRPELQSGFGYGDCAAESGVRWIFTLPIFVRPTVSRCRRVRNPG